MSSFYGDLIVPDITPFEMLHHYSVKDVEVALTSLSWVAKEIGLDEIWSRTRIIGTDGNEYFSKSKPEILGQSMAFACTVGVGFWRDYYLHFEIPDIDQRIVESNESSARQAMAKQRVEKAQSDMMIRQPEVEAIQQIAEAATRRVQLPLRSAFDVRGTWAYPFDIAYRRRLAYILGFESSIKIQSLSPYDNFIHSLINGSLDELKSLCPSVKTSESFSIYLNLLAKLSLAVSYQIKKGEVSPNLPGEVKDGSTKRAFLSDQLQSAACIRMNTLFPDAQIALNALLKEVEYIQERGFHYNLQLPRWGLIAPSKSYAASD
jgi:hypothetical protein